mmetsp:Transcript_1556/g.5866  ORF Transcript_1556/g.5866 Transcript_1556/m.5866 type:complete len:218 (+) Transcript_1556:3710-4363(+)
MRPSPGVTSPQNAFLSPAHTSAKNPSYRMSSLSSTSRLNTSNLHCVLSSARLSFKHCSVAPPPHFVPAHSFTRSSSHINARGASSDMSAACSICRNPTTLAHSESSVALCDFKHRNTSPRPGLTSAQNFEMSPPATASPRAALFTASSSSSGSGCVSTLCVVALCPPPQTDINSASFRISVNRRWYVSLTSARHAGVTTCFARRWCTSTMFACTHSK